jgi:hypothetical protein
MALTLVIVLAGAALLTWALFWLLARGPGSLRAEYTRDVDGALARIAPDGGIIADADLAHLPAPVRRYLQVAGAVGRPRVQNFRARMRGRIRNGPAAPWIPLAAEQYNFVGEPARFFYLNGSMMMIPVLGYHRYAGASATMTIKAAALFRVAAAAGAEATQSETVTLFNDMCVMAPGTLIDPAITWEAVDARTARATFTNAGFSIRAELAFNEAGELMNFWSDDRYQLAPDGGMRKLRWSTPLKNYRTRKDFHLASAGEGRWFDPAGEYAYIELTIDDVEYNVRSRS